MRSGQSKMNNKNADVAADLRQRIARPLRWGLLLLVVGLVSGSACLAAVFLIPGKSALIFCSVAGSLLVFIGFAGLGLALLQRTRWQRSLALVKVADQLDLSFQERGASHLCEGLQHLNMFSDSYAIGAANVLSGEIDGSTITIVDCIVSAGQGQNQAAFENTIFVLQNIPRQVPNFFLTPHDFFSRRLSLNSKQIEIPKQSEFSKRFLLQGKDEEAIVETFNPKVIALCLASGNQSVEVRKPFFVVRQRGKLLPPTRYRDFLLHSLELARALGAAAEA